MECCYLYSYISEFCHSSVFLCGDEKETANESEREQIGEALRLKSASLDAQIFIFISTNTTIFQQVQCDCKISISLVHKIFIYIYIYMNDDNDYDYELNVAATLKIHAYSCLDSWSMTLPQTLLVRLFYCVYIRGNIVMSIGISQHYDILPLTIIIQIQHETIREYLCTSL